MIYRKCKFGTARPRIGDHDLRRIARDVYSGTLCRGTSPAFNATPFNPASVVAIAAATATITFSDYDKATLAYTVDGLSGTKAITREVFSSPVPTCVWGAQPDPGLSSNAQGLWWASPAGSESGWGINLTHQGDTIFGTWFAFGLDGKPMWMVVGAPKAAENVYSGTLFTATGPSFSTTVPFDPGKVAGTFVGTASFTFADGNNATFAYTVNGVSQAKQITRQVFSTAARSASNSETVLTPVSLASKCSATILSKR